MSALGNGSQISEFKAGSALPVTLPSGTHGGNTQANMHSKLVGGKKRKSTKKSSTKKSSTKKSSTKKSSTKKSISSKIKSVGKMMKFWK